MEDNLINNELNLDQLGRPILKYYDTSRRELTAFIDKTWDETEVQSHKREGIRRNEDQNHKTVHAGAVLIRE